jgi:primase-polymerase (primpol)-like protein
MSRFEFTTQQDSEDNTGGGDCLPSRLKEPDQWLITHDTPWNDDLHKEPKHPRKGWNDDGATLLTFEGAYDRFNSAGNTGIAFRFTDDGPFVGFDFDKVRLDGDFTEEVLDLVQRLNSYTEVSSSGKGLHVIAEGDHLDDRKNEGQLSDRGELEVYDTDRYFVLTGDVYDGFTSVESRHTVARNIQEEYLSIDDQPTTGGDQKPVSEQEFDGGEADATPEQVRQTIRAYVKTDSHDVDREVLRLCRGSNEGRASPSDADMAFVKQLYYWCKGDQQLMDECFRASSRYGMRSQPTPKWDEVHYSNGDTYGERIIQKVCRTNGEIFGGRFVK